MIDATIALGLNNLCESNALAQRTLDFLIAHRVAATPRNYTVLYHYFEGTNSELQTALDRYLDSGRPLDHMIIHTLYERHVALDQFTFLRGMDGNLEKILNLLLSEIERADEDAKLFAETLQSGIVDLTANPPARPVRSVAAELLIASEQTRRQNIELQERLENTLAETISLRDELEQRRRDALLDPLTGLLNRRAMDAQFSELMYPGPSRAFSLLMIDIDHFKAINDNYGHTLGDAVIRNVADMIRKYIRGGDAAVRYGGEEFLIILPDTPIDGAVTVAETIRSQIEALRLKRNRDNLMLRPITVSVGVAARSEADTQESLLLRVDRALYVSKKSGRNKVTVETHEVSV